MLKVITLALAAMKKMILGPTVKGNEQSKEVMGTPFVMKATWQEVMTNLAQAVKAEISMQEVKTCLP